MFEIEGICPKKEILNYNSYMWIKVIAMYCLKI